MFHFRQILRDFDITEQQWRVIRTLNERGDMEPNQLAEACLILSPSLTRMLSLMETDGLVTRTRSDIDQRRQNIALTDKSRRLIQELEPLIEAQYRQIENALELKRIEKLYASLDNLLEVMDSTPIPTVAILRSVQR